MTQLILLRKTRDSPSVSQLTASSQLRLSNIALKSPSSILVENPVSVQPMNNPNHEVILAQILEKLENLTTANALLQAKVMSN
jgi:hypothetical protein